MRSIFKKAGSKAWGAYGKIKVVKTSQRAVEILVRFAGSHCSLGSGLGQPSHKVLEDMQPVLRIVGGQGGTLRVGH